MLKCTGDIKKAWNVMKDLIGKSKIKSTNLPRKLAINKVDVYSKPEIADPFNDFFTNIGQKLASQISKSSITFETYINKVNVIMDPKPLSINELKNAFFSLKVNKSSGADDVSFNIIEKCFGVLCKPLIYLFQLSLEKGVFPDDLKIAKVTPTCKAGDNSGISNYRLKSVLPCFSKILELLMYNHLYKYLKENNILYEKQFGFQSGYSTNDAIVQLVDKIFYSFEKEQFTLGVFIDLSKAFDTVDHSILLKKLKLYGITDKNLAWFESYLSNRKQYIETGENSKIDLKYVTCGVPKDLFLDHVCFWYMLTTCHKDIKHLFIIVNNELINIKDWFNANKLSLNVEKTKYSFFHKPSKKDDIPLHLSKLIFNNYEIQREESIKFLGVLLDQHLTWKEHIKLTENSILYKDILYKARPYLDKRALLSLYYSYIHSYLNYANTPLSSTNRTYLKKT